ncbi:DUF7550 family protein [Halobellus captivus]|uniref:DUF7550 family protein n=1 Tax=Halobellus captivus TaxID=2592614 RepID=UPI0011A79514|nr:hypothetical protein [Halobellus captivus]
MSDHDEHGDDHGYDEHGDGHGPDEHGSELVETRVTSPMQEYGMGRVTTGLIVLAIGLVVVFGIPLLV